MVVMLVAALKGSVGAQEQLTTLSLPTLFLHLHTKVLGGASPL